METAKIEGRDISYPYLLDEKGDPRLESTNDFLVWYCEHADIVTKKSVVEKAERGERRVLQHARLVPVLLRCFSDNLSQ